MTSSLDIAVMLLTVYLLLGIGCRTASAGEAGILSSLRPEHPRLMFTQEREEQLREQLKEDAFLQEVLEIALREANAALDDGVIEHKKKGKRLLAQTRDSLSRITHLAFAYRVTGERKYLERAETEMFAAAALSDWNPSHFLDVAEMAAGLAIGYDWLYHELSEETRATVREALVEKAFQPAFGEKVPNWVNGQNNWNQVCNTGLALASLAIAEDEPQWAERAVSRAIEKIQIAMDSSYPPQGVYPEGPMYWGYGTMYNVLLISGLDSALGSDFALADKEGFLQSAYYHINSIEPDGNYYKYSDCGPLKMVSPQMYWFATKFNKPELAYLNNIAERKVFEKLKNETGRRNNGRLFPLLLVWYTGAEKPESALDNDYFGQGSNPIAIFRSSWESPEAPFLLGKLTRNVLPLLSKHREEWRSPTPAGADLLGIKGGNNRNGHCHMDSGSFVISAGGVRWVEDLGMDNYYNLEQISKSLWGGLGRYSFFRLGLQGHSTLTINNSMQELDDSASPIIAFYSSPARSHAIVDMSRPWRSQAKEVLRGAAMLDQRSFLIQDEIGEPSGEIHWQAITVEDIELQGDRAVMSKNGKRFIAQILTPQGAAFEKLSARPEFDGENQNEGFARLAFKVAEPAEERTVLAVQMWLDEGPEPERAKVEPLKNWQR